jgi:hypothetical protein
VPRYDVGERHRGVMYLGLLSELSSRILFISPPLMNEMKRDGRTSRAFSYSRPSSYRVAMWSFVNAIGTSTSLILQPRRAGPSESPVRGQIHARSPTRDSIAMRTNVVRVIKAIHHCCDGCGNIEHKWITPAAARHWESCGK